MSLKIRIEDLARVTQSAVVLQTALVGFREAVGVRNLSAKECERYTLQLTAPHLTPADPVKVAKPATQNKAASQARNAKQAQNRISLGRRAVSSGQRPKIAEAVSRVMGTSKMDAPTIVQELTQRGWLPNTVKPQNYVSFVLSSNKELFKRVERGIYQVIQRGPEKIASKPTPSMLTEAKSGKSFGSRLRDKQGEPVTFLDPLLAMLKDSAEKRVDLTAEDAWAALKKEGYTYLGSDPVAATKSALRRMELRA